MEELKQIWDAIPWDEPMDSRDISDAAGVPRGRTCEKVREAVRIFRKWGLPVVSGDGGFMKTTSPAALAACARDLSRRAQSTQQQAERMLDRITEGWGRPAYEELFRSKVKAEE